MDSILECSQEDIKNIKLLIKKAIFRNLVNLNEIYPKLSSKLEDNVDYFLINTQDIDKHKIRNFNLLLKINKYAFFCKDPLTFENDLKNQRISPIVSVCIPTISHRLNILKYCLNFWENQRFIHPKLYEIIIVINDYDYHPESTKFVKELKNSKVPITILTQDENNIAKARAMAAAVAKGHYLLLVNDDTIPENTLIYKHLNVQAKFFNQKVAVIGKFLIDKPFIKNEYDKKLCKSGLDFPQNGINIRTATKDIKFFATNNLSIKRDLFFEVKGFSPIFKDGAEDSDFGIRFFNSGGTLIIEPEIIAKHHHNYLPELEKVYKKRGENSARLAYEHLSLKDLNKEKLFAIFRFSEIMPTIMKINKNLLHDSQKLLSKELLLNLHLKLGYLEAIKNLIKDKAFLNSKNLPKISIIIATLNSEKFIYETLNSITNQTYKNYEVIVVDNGCTDKTIEIVKTFKEKFKNIIITKEEIKGQSFARNKGAKLATGEYLLFFDADDILLNYSLDLFAIHCLIYDSPDIIYGNFYIKDINNKLQLRKMVNISNFSLKDKILIQIRGNAFPLGATLIKRNFFFQIDCFRNSKIFAEDYDLWNRAILKNAKINHIDIPMYIYRLHENQYTRNTNMDEKVDNSLIFLLKEIEKLHPDLLSEDFLKNATLFALSREEYVSKSSKHLINLLEKTCNNQKEIKIFKKLYMRKFSKKI